MAEPVNRAALCRGRRRLVERVNRAAMRRHASLGSLSNHIAAWCTIASVLIGAILAQTTALAIGIVAAASLLKG